MTMDVRAERVAQAFHEAYERLAPDFGYKTREASAKPWAEVPEDNRNLMIAVAAELLARGMISTDRAQAGPVPTVEELRAGSRWRPTDPQIKPTP